MTAVVSIGPPQALPSFAASVSGPRSPTNEDATLALNDYGIYCVFDGMGGHRNGARASAIAATTLRRLLDAARTHSVAIIEQAVQSANEAIARDAARSAGGGPMGATVAMCWIRERRMTCFHAGDSRVYRMRDFRLDRLTRDHHREADVRANIGLENHPVRAITRALGMGSALKIEITEADWQPGDIAMLCTDGVTDVLADFECANIMVDRLGEPAAMAEALVEASQHSSDDRTVLVVAG